jgi:hypothetical protein
LPLILFPHAERRRLPGGVAASGAWFVVEAETRAGVIGAQAKGPPIVIFATAHRVIAVLSKASAPKIGRFAQLFTQLHGGSGARRRSFDQSVDPGRDMLSEVRSPGNQRIPVGRAAQARHPLPTATDNSGEAGAKTISFSSGNG